MADAGDIHSAIDTIFSTAIVGRRPSFYLSPEPSSLKNKIKEALRQLSNVIYVPTMMSDGEDSTYTYLTQNGQTQKFIFTLSFGSHPFPNIPERDPRFPRYTDALRHAPPSVDLVTVQDFADFFRDHNHIVVAYRSQHIDDVRCGAEMAHVLLEIQERSQEKGGIPHLAEEIREIANAYLVDPNVNNLLRYIVPRVQNLPGVNTFMRDDTIFMPSDCFMAFAEPTGDRRWYKVRSLQALSDYIRGVNSNVQMGWSRSRGSRGSPRQRRSRRRGSPRQRRSRGSPRRRSK